MHQQYQWLAWWPRWWWCHSLLPRKECNLHLTGYWEYWDQNCNRDTFRFAIYIFHESFLLCVNSTKPYLFVQSQMQTLTCWSSVAQGHAKPAWIITLEMVLLTVSLAIWLVIAMDLHVTRNWRQHLFIKELMVGNVTTSSNYCILHVFCKLYLFLNKFNDVLSEQFISLLASIASLFE